MLSWRYNDCRVNINHFILQPFFMTLVFPSRTVRFWSYSSYNLVRDKMFRYQIELCYDTSVSLLFKPAGKILLYSSMVSHARSNAVNSPATARPLSDPDPGHDGNQKAAIVKIRIPLISLQTHHAVSPGTLYRFMYFLQAVM